MTEQEYLDRLKKLMESLHATISVWRQLNSVDESETLCVMQGVEQAFSMSLLAEEMAGNDEDEEEEEAQGNSTGAAP